MDAESGLAHSVRGTSGAVSDVIEATVLCAGATTMSMPTLATKLRANALTPGAT